MFPYRIRIIVLFLLWIGCFVSAYPNKTELLGLLILAAGSFAIYFIIPLLKSPTWAYFLLIMMLSLSGFIVSKSTFLYILFISAFYLLDSGMAIKMKPFRYLVASFIVLSLMLFIYNENKYDVIPFTTALILFSITVLYMNTYYFYLKEQRELYDELLSFYRKTKRQAIENEKSMLMEERTRIAREMHDSVGHKLTALTFQMEMLSMQLDNDTVQKMKELVNDALNETRKAVRALKVEEVEGISSILFLIRKLEAESHMQIHFTTKQGVLGLSLADDVSIVLYRTLQEALTNAMKYAHTREVFVTLGISANGELMFVIKNKVHQPKPFYEGFGLQNMKERISGLGGTVYMDQTADEFVIHGTLPSERESGV